MSFYQQRSFYREVSMSELLYFREKEGLSNREIATRCGVSYLMVLNAIGKQPNKKEREKNRELYSANLERL